MSYESGLIRKALEEFGAPIRAFPIGRVDFRRPIPETLYQDATGPYPLFCCREWSGLKNDFEALAGQLVSLVLSDRSLR